MTRTPTKHTHKWAIILVFPSILSVESLIHLFRVFKLIDYEWIMNLNYLKIIKFTVLDLNWCDRRLWHSFAQIDYHAIILNLFSTFYLITKRIFNFIHLNLIKRCILVKIPKCEEKLDDSWRYTWNWTEHKNVHPIETKS